jgi:hypothetical protein
VSIDDPIDYVLLANFDAPHCESCLRPGRVRGRGLCPLCYERHWRGGTLAIFDRKCRRGAEVLTEVQHLRSAGVPERDLPARLGMSRPALGAALRRARA